MAEAESKFWTFLKGVGGVSGAVLTAVLIYKFTSSQPTPPPAPQPVAINGYVDDSRTHQLVRSASVTFVLGPNKVEQLTDAGGRYSVVLAATGPNADMGSVAIHAKGYEPFSNSVPLHPGDNFAEITLDSISAPVPGPAAAAGGHGPVETFPLHNAAIIFKKQPANFIKPAETKYVGVKHP